MEIALHYASIDNWKAVALEIQLENVKNTWTADNGKLRMLYAIWNDTATLFGKNDKLFGTISCGNRGSSTIATAPSFVVITRNSSFQHFPADERNETDVVETEASFSK